MKSLDTVIEIIVANAKSDVGPIDAGTRLSGLGIDSMDVLQIIFDLEARFAVEVPDGAIEDLNSKTVGELATLLDQIKDGTWKPTA